MGLGTLTKQQQQQRQSNERLALVVDNSLSPLSRTTKAAFGLGHVLNDLAAAMWFSYTLLFLQRVARFDPLTAGTLLLLGELPLSYIVYMNLPTSREIGNSCNAYGRFAAFKKRQFNRNHTRKFFWTTRPSQDNTVHERNLTPDPFGRHLAM